MDGVKLPQSLRSLKIGLESLESLESPTALDSLKLDELEYLDEFMCQGLTVGCNNVAPLAGWLPLDAVKKGAEDLKLFNDEHQT